MLQTFSEEMNIKDNKLKEEPTLEQPQVKPSSTVIDFD
jgi:hypothetical protein